MKKIKINLSKMTILVVFLFLAGTMSSCDTKSQKEAEEQTEEPDHHDSTERQDHHQDGLHHDEGANEPTSGSMMWMPEDQSFTGMLKLVHGNEASLTPSVTSDSDGSKVLNLTLTGDKVILLFNGAWENVGANLQFKTKGFQGEVAVVHHYTDASNYDYVSLTKSTMKLGRIENGKDKVMDNQGMKMPADWATLTVSSAGEHYKGYLNEKLVTHGHGETRVAGQVGVMLNGKGKVMMKMMEVIKLTE